MSIQRYNDDTGKWEPAKPLPYYADLRPTWQKLLELPFRLLGIVRYDPLVPVPPEEMDFTKEKNI